jgi:hypothetical protein
MYRMKIQLTREVLICWGSTHKVFNLYIYIYIACLVWGWLLILAECARTWQYTLSLGNFHFPNALEFYLTILPLLGHEKKSYLGGEIVEGWSKRKLSLAQWALFNQDLKLIKIIGLPQIFTISFKDYYNDWRGSLFHMFWPAGKEEAPWKSMWGPIECPQSQNSKDCWLFIGVRACCWLTMWEQWLI